MREILINLMRSFQTEHNSVIPDRQGLADHIIASGVTVQKWIPVTEMLPEQNRTVLVIDRVTGEVTTAFLNIFNSFVFKDGRGHGASYWMPLPKPPNREDTEC